MSANFMTISVTGLNIAEPVASVAMTIVMDMALFFILMHSTKLSTMSGITPMNAQSSLNVRRYMNCFMKVNGRKFLEVGFIDASGSFTGASVKSVSISLIFQGKLNRSKAINTKFEKNVRYKIAIVVAKLEKIITNNKKNNNTNTTTNMFPNRLANENSRVKQEQVKYI